MQFEEMKNTTLNAGEQMFDDIFEHFLLRNRNKKVCDCRKCEFVRKTVITNQSEIRALFNKDLVINWNNE